MWLCITETTSPSTLTKPPPSNLSISLSCMCFFSLHTLLHSFFCFPPSCRHILPSGALSAVVLVVVLVYLMSFLDCEATPPPSSVCPRCSYGNKSGFKMHFYSFLSLSLCCFLLLLSSLFREKHDDLSCLTTTARTPRETPVFGRTKNLCRGRTGADGVAGWRGRGAQQPAR